MIYLLTIQGKDQLGLVEALASLVEEQGGNWLESRLCRLGGQFAGIARIEFSSEPAALPSSVETLVCHWELVELEQVDEEIDYGKARVDILAADRPGIIKQITRVLKASGANIEEIESRVKSAPFSGEQMFEARCLVRLSASTDRVRLAQQLESLAEELMCDIDFSDQLDAVLVRP